MTTKNKKSVLFLADFGVEVVEYLGSEVFKKHLKRGKVNRQVEQRFECCSGT